MEYCGGNFSDRGVLSLPLSLSLFHLLESTNCTTPDIFYDILHSLPKEAERDDSDSFFFSFLITEELIKPFTTLLESGRNGESRERREKDRRARYLEGNGMTGIGH